MSVSLPTGFGKSVCFQSPPFVFDCLKSSQSSYMEDRHIALVEPTAAVMRHQVARFNNHSAILFLKPTTEKSAFLY